RGGEHARRGAGAAAAEPRVPERRFPGADERLARRATPASHRLRAAQPSRNRSERKKRRTRITRTRRMAAPA
ncbi:hypothetical protein, partial [Burkholderia thailandensis]|uniref:hypothetical protein n=1 Tax=Burkholderia thailandensis TaxID=57975 RepID=UPI001E5DB56B